MFEKNLAALSTAALGSLKDMRRGIEKESLRVDPKGYLSQQNHPRALGSTLKHPFITTDYSEALLEFITPAFSSYHEPIDFLETLHTFTYQHLEQDEKLWVNSMPCALTADRDVPIADYGTSNLGKMKSIYRVGLGHRYGRSMQTIAGIHYNISFPKVFWEYLQQQQAPELPYQDFVDQGYFSLVRNFHRYSWLLVYLFGASPAVCQSFFGKAPTHLTRLATHTVAAPLGTSLRMSDLGYQNSAQAQIKVSYNSLNEYVSALFHAVDTPYPPFEALALKEGMEWKQLNTHLLQIENEYYSVIRPKRSVEGDERPLTALKKRGVEYIELRCLDLDPFCPIGISEEQFHFLDLFCGYCLLEESPAISEEESLSIQRRLQQVVYHGREPNILLEDIEGAQDFKTTALTLLAKIELLAKQLDSAQDTHIFSEAIKTQRSKIEHPETTPSAQVMEHLLKNDQCFFTFAMEQAELCKRYFDQKHLSQEENNFLTQLANQSLAQQTHLEQTDTLSFDAFLERYFQQH